MMMIFELQTRNMIGETKSKKKKNGLFFNFSIKHQGGDEEHLVDFLHSLYKSLVLIHSTAQTRTIPVIQTLGKQREDRQCYLWLDGEFKSSLGYINGFLLKRKKNS